MVTDLDIYRRREAEALERIDADLKAGRGASTLDVYRLELNRSLIKSIEDGQKELVEVQA